VVAASVGYTGSQAPNPTYGSVCGGDGHTESVRIVFDPRVVDFEALIRQFIEDPKVPNVWSEEEQDPQYQVAIWAQSPEQRATASRVSAEVGKYVPVLDASEWYDAEPSHQQFFGPAVDPANLI